MLFFGLGLAVFSLSSLTAYATTTITGVSGASNSDFSVATTPKIYGGHVLNWNTCTQNNVNTQDNVNTCNTCDGVCLVAGMCPCNQTSIYPNLALAASFSSTIDLGGRVILYQVVSPATAATAFSSTPLASGATTFSFSKPWKEWCALAGLTTACENGALDGATISVIVGPSKTTSTTEFEENEKITLEIRIGIVDHDLATPYFTECPGAAGAVREGICYYLIERGDEKVFVTVGSDERASDYPTASADASGLEYSSLLFFYKEATSAASITNADDAAELVVDTSGTDISFDDRITGLSNDTNYCFVLGNMDKAGNVHSFQDPAAAGLDARACAMPSVVEGLLDDKKCFIATAAFGSKMDPHVDLLRQFRARFLMPTQWGTKFVKFYYNHSSVWAQKIRQSNLSRAVVRGFLWPVVGFAALSLEIGLAASLALIFSVLTMLGFLIFWRKKIKSKIFAQFGILIWLSLLSVNVTLSSPAQAQSTEPTSSSPAIDDFEEGGPPTEPPYVESEADEFSEDFNTPPVASPVRESAPEVIAAPVARPTPSEPPVVSKAYTVPKAPQTQEGRELGHEKIHHPMSRQGLLSIEKDGSYHYEPIKFETKNESVGVRAGGIKPPPNIVGPDGETTFESMYGGSPAQVSVDYEWYPFVRWGKLGLQGGVGFFTSTGNGRFTYSETDPTALCNNDTEDCEAKEKYVFYGVPLSLGVTYRLQVTDRPYFAPYIVGGGSYYILVEKRDDGKPLKAVGTSAAYGGGGVMFNISAFDRSTAFTLESEYGLHNVWINADYRYIASLSQVLDVSASIISLGIVMDY